MKNEDLFGRSKFLQWQQLNGCIVTRPFHFLRRVLLVRLIVSEIKFMSVLVSPVQCQWHDLCRQCVIRLD